MASIQKRGDSYRISVSCGYVGKKKQMVSMTWTPDPSLSPKKIQSELDRVKFEFEKKVKTGHYLQGEKLTFAEFVDVWFKDHANKHLKPKTIEDYHQLLNLRILPGIGHYKLSEVTPSVLIRFMNALEEPGMNQHMRFKAKDDIKKLWEDSGLTCAKAGLARQFLTPIFSLNNVSFKTADRFTQAMRTVNKKAKLSDYFIRVDQPKALSANTVSHYLRCISTILTTAVHWQIIEANPCDRVKAPKIEKVKIKYLEIDEAKRLNDEAKKIEKPQKRIAALIFINTGIRRSELSGLRWSDFDFDGMTLSINRILQPLDGQGMVVGSPKTESGERTFSISKDLVDFLKKYRLWQNEQKLKVGSMWQWQGRQAAESEGKPFEPIDWVFTGDLGDHLHSSTIYHWVKSFLIEQGHPDMTVHGLRHTNISLMLANGVDLITASKRAGHAKPSITADIYAHALKKPDKEAANLIDDLLNPSVKDTAKSNS